MPKLSEAHATARRQQILEATFRCLAQKGYSRLTMRDIAAEAGISVGTLYLYFKNKDEMVQALSEASREQTDTGIAEQLPPGGPLEVLGSILQFLLRGLDDPRRERELRVDVQLWAEALHHESLRDLFQSSLADRSERLAALVSGAKEAGELPAETDAVAVARLLMAILIGLELQKVMEPELACEDLIPSISQLVSGMRSAK